MTNRAPTKHSEQALNDALGAPRKPLLKTATLKRRALKKNAGEIRKKSRNGGCHPGNFVCAATGMIAAIAGANQRSSGRLGSRDIARQSSGLTIGSSGGSKVKSPNGL
jgi:hypothetical protein